MSDEDGPNWTDGKKRPRPAALSGGSVEVSRASGLSQGTGTFGKSNRFADKKVIGHGASSPYGHLFYHRNQLYKHALEVEKSCSLGIGERPALDSGGPPGNVGPGSYNIVHSAKGTTSSLDGPEFCKTTIKVKLPSSLTGLPMPSPGPHARYEVRGDLDAHFPQYAKHKPLLGHNARFAESAEDRNSPGPGAYHTHLVKCLSLSASCPNLLGAGDRCMEATGGSKRTLKSTFGVANRFAKDKVPNCSPQGDRFYAHSRIWNSEEYLKGARSCSFGASGKTDMSNPLKGGRNNVSPVTYYPNGGFSAAGRTSPLDGHAARCISPVHQFSKNLGTGKSADKRRSPQGDSSSIDPMSPGGGGSPGGGAMGGMGDA